MNVSGDYRENPGYFLLVLFRFCEVIDIKEIVNLNMQIMTFLVISINPFVVLNSFYDK